jgi:hypothetical protein
MRLPGADAVVYVYEARGRLGAIAYERWADEPAWHVRSFATESRRRAYVDEYLSSRRLTCELRRLLRTVRTRQAA